MGFQHYIKGSVPLGPILSFIGRYNYECATWLSEILTPLRHHKATVKDSFEFLQQISNMTSDGKIMSSLDVRNDKLDQLQGVSEKMAANGIRTHARTNQ